jgi:hypothetical protein
VWLERRAGAADGPEGGQLVTLTRFDAAVLLDGDPLGRSPEYSDVTLVHLSKTRVKREFNFLLFKDKGP